MLVKGYGSGGPTAEHEIKDQNNMQQRTYHNALIGLEPYLHRPADSMNPPKNQNHVLYSVVNFASRCYLSVAHNGMQRMSSKCLNVPYSTLKYFEVIERAPHRVLTCYYKASAKHLKSRDRKNNR